LKRTVVFLEMEFRQQIGFALGEQFFSPVPAIFPAGKMILPVRNVQVLSAAAAFSQM